MKKSRLLGVVICLLALKVNAAVIDFEEFQSSAPLFARESGDLIFHQTYSGFGGIYVQDVSSLYGQFDFASSGVMGAYFSHGLSISTINGSPFDFISVYSAKTHCCSDFDRITIEGIRNGQTVYTVTNISRLQEPVLNQFNWIAIDEVIISTLIDVSGGFFIMDDLEYSVVPIPAAVWLFGSGLLGLIGIARKKAA